MHPKINLIIGFDPRFVCFFANLRLVGHASRPKWLSLFALFCVFVSYLEAAVQVDVVHLRLLIDDRAVIKKWTIALKCFSIELSLLNPFHVHLV